MSDVRMAYVGSLPCGCIVSAVVDDPERPAIVGAVVAKMIRDGETVARRPIAEVKADPLFLRDCGSHRDTAPLWEGVGA